MNVVTALNRNYLRYTVVMLTSLCINNPEEDIVAYLLHHELREEDVEEMQKSLGKYRINVVPVPVDRERFSSRLKTTEMWSVETLFRLLIPELLPHSVDRILYLDVDMIINKSISDLYYTDFGDLEIIATSDADGRISWEQFEDIRQRMFAPMIAAGYRYINAGMMLLNMEKIRKNYSFETYVKAMEEWEYQMPFLDQDIINYVHWQRVGYVDADTYDLMVGYAHAEGMTYVEAKEKVAILHFTGPKPWHNKNFHFPIQQIWWDYAKETPYYHELLEDFVQTAMFDPTIENIMTEYANGGGEAEELRSKLSESLELNQKLIALISDNSNVS